ncbi:UNVERIFIED_CONTAM: Retrovirus-related Pol polyprotein from transposon TNT 1-94 [Sesamum calycinum]|uniref:Retrovirus-related Pol polyprotein from transposon TNT 1-94 n=1 Tax=Sesamum calycinum TaxID=2727403 RepID=A0AAW2P9H6_9LAMI
MVQIITGVFYVPELKSNLLSIGQWQEKGLTIIFQHDRCMVYELNVQATCYNFTTNLFQLIHKDKVQLWHCRYGHLSYKGLKTLQQKKIVNGLPELKSPSEFCKDCLVGKQQRTPFPKKTTWRETQILQLIHTDICGPINPTSNSGKRDVVFEEDKAWDWDHMNESTVVCDLEWGDHENQVTRTDETEGGVELEADTETPSSHSSTDDDDDASSTAEGRNRAPPVWMRD